MISFSHWYLASREGICLVFVSGVTAIATCRTGEKPAWQVNQVPWRNLLLSAGSWGVKTLLSSGSIFSVLSRSSLYWGVCRCCFFPPNGLLDGLVHSHLSSHFTQSTLWLAH